MKSKAWFYLSLLTILALLTSPTMAQTANPSSTNENSTLTTIQVTSKEDNTVVDGYCTLREALQAANTHSAVDSCQQGSEFGNTITFTITGTITLVADDLYVTAISGSLVIDGGGEITISGGNSVGVFSVANAANVTFENLSITDGYAPDGGGIYNNGTVIILNSTLSGNEASAVNGHGGAIYNNAGSAVITNSTLSDNYAASGGAIYNYNGYSSITNSTLSGNIVASEGGGIYSTGDLFLYNATVANNLAGTLGGGIYTQSQPLDLHNTILAENAAGVNGPECYGTNVTSYGYNLIGNTAGCDIYPWTGDLTNVSPMLGPLQDNGGLTYTHALLPSSLAINRGNRNGCSGYSTLLTTDQRGFPRAGRCDIGAYEWQPEVAGPYSVNLPSVFRACPSRLYFDDFSNPSSGWKVLENAYGRYEYLNNEYRILAKLVPTWEGSFPGFQATNYVASVDVRNATGVNGWAGILFGFAPDWSHFYFFVVNTGDIASRYNITQFDLADAPWIGDGYTGAIHWGTESNRLQLERNGDMIWAYANGELLTIIKDSSFTGQGFIGLITIANLYPNVDARFDNFTVEPISCGASYNYPLPAAGASEMEAAKPTPRESWSDIPLPWQIGK